MSTLTMMIKTFILGIAIILATFDFYATMKLTPKNDIRSSFVMPLKLYNGHYGGEEHQSPISAEKDFVTMNLSPNSCCFD
jgi:hypothetical protein